MRVLFWMYEGGELPGGHSVQWQKTAAALEDLGVHVEISGAKEVPLREFDLVQGYGLLLPQVRACRLAHKPLALSTIYWSRAYRAGFARPRWSAEAVQHRMRLSLVFTREILSGRALEKCDHYMARWTQLRAIYENADVLLPNSAEERDQIIADLGVSTPMHLVPNGVDAEAFPLTTTPRAGVLYIGRFEPHKNQLGLIRALKDSGLSLTLMGPPHAHHPQYYEECLREAEATGATILGPLPHEELAPIYAAHRVHVLPSWFETTGLVSLEAALCGCNIVTTSRGYARSYFGEFAWYCDPARPEGIRRAVQAAHDAPVQTALRELILRDYTWRRAGEETLRAYEKVTSRTRETVLA